MTSADERHPGEEVEGHVGSSASDGEGQLTLEERLERLSEIVGSLEAEDLGLDRALELFEEGVGHIREAEELLSRAELEVEELVGEGGEARTRPFEGGGGPEGGNEA